MKSVSLVLFRHAERNKFIEDEPQLSPFGLKQAQHLSMSLDNLGLENPNCLFTSPRHRAIQTFQPLASKFNLKSQIKNELDEKKEQESLSQFRIRIAGFINWIPSLNGQVFLCSHLDWIEEALSLIESEEDLLKNPGVNWAPTQFLKLDYDFKNEIWSFSKTNKVTF